MTDRTPPTYRPPLYNLKEAPSSTKRAHGQHERESQRSSEQQGWEAYRKWLSRVSARPTRDRSPKDHSLYSWKGYNNWAESVKAAWKPEDGET